MKCWKNSEHHDSITDYITSTYDEHEDSHNSETSTLEEYNNKNEQQVSTASEHGNIERTFKPAKEIYRNHVSKKEIKEYLGYYVRIIFTDGEERRGTLGYTSKFCKEQGWRKPHNFTLGNLDFKTSYVKYIELADHE